MHRFIALFNARTMEFVRDRGTFFWNLLFPIVLVFGFAFAFSGDEQELFTVGVIGKPDQPIAFLEIEEIAFVPYTVTERGDAAPTGAATDPAATARATTVPTVAAVVERVRRHQLDMVIDFTAGEYYINSESAAGPLLRRLLETSAGAGAGPAPADPPAANHATPAAPPPSLTERAVAGEPIRYVDWLVPGVIGMNMMFSCLFGVGFVIVRYRKNGVLKRLKATPVPAFTFVAAQAASRLIIVVITSVVVYAGTNIFLNFMMNGSYLTLLLLTTVSILCMISIGLVFAARIRSEELAGGLLNLITFPMIILSGVFFSLEGTPEIMQRLSRALPLTHFTEGARAIMIEGAGLAEIMPNLLFLGALTAVFLSVSAVLFKWE